MLVYTFADEAILLAARLIVPGKAKLRPHIDARFTTAACRYIARTMISPTRLSTVPFCEQHSAELDYIPVVLGTFTPLHFPRKPRVSPGQRRYTLSGRPEIGSFSAVANRASHSRPIPACKQSTNAITTFN